MRSAEGISGTFLLGSGGFESTSYYHYLSTTEDGGYKPGKVRADPRYVTLYEEQRTDGMILVYDEALVNDLNRWFVIPSLYEQYYDIYVPEGSIRFQYNIE